MVAKVTTPTCEEIERDYVPEPTPEEEDLFYALLDLDEEGLKDDEILKRKTKIFVGGLKFTSEDNVLQDYFQRFGDIKEAVVIRDRKTGYSKGYGFVTMTEFKSAIRAISDKSPKLDGRRCNVNLAYIGQKKNGFPPSGANKRMYYGPPPYPEFSPVPQYYNPYNPQMQMQPPVTLVTQNGQVLYMQPPQAEPMFVPVSPTGQPIYEPAHEIYSPAGQPQMMMSPPQPQIVYAQPQMVHVDYNNNAVAAMPQSPTDLSYGSNPATPDSTISTGSPGPQQVITSQPQGPHLVNGMVVNGSHVVQNSHPIATDGSQQIVVSGKPVMVSGTPPGPQREVIEVITTGGDSTPSDASSLSPSGQPQGQVNVLTSYHVPHSAGHLYNGEGHVTNGPVHYHPITVSGGHHVKTRFVQPGESHVVPSGHWTSVPGSSPGSSPPTVAHGHHVYQFQPIHPGPATTRVIPQYQACK